MEGGIWRPWKIREGRRKDRGGGMTGFFSTTTVYTSSVQRRIVSDCGVVQTNFLSSSRKILFFYRACSILGAISLIITACYDHDDQLMV